MIILSKSGKDRYSGKDRCHMISLTCGILRKMIQMNLFTKQKQTHRHRKLVLPKGRVSENVSYSVVYDSLQPHGL